MVHKEVTKSLTQLKKYKNAITFRFLNKVFCTFALHQKKGGIHAIYRYNMDTFGNFLVRRTVRQNNLMA